MLEIDLANEINPLIVADAIRQAVANGLRNESMSLYSGLLLNQDELKLRQLARGMPAWGSQFSLSDALSLYMQHLFGLAVGETTIARTAANWVARDLPFLSDTRGHYIRKHLELLSDEVPSKACLRELSMIRLKYDELSDDDGPYHTEVFPYDYFRPEDVLLGHAVSNFEASELEPYVEDTMLALSEWTWKVFGD